uniref:Uncharacterized protein n=1 Tax=Anguilla anguilla TaxID=7936 RepID=A0A0E9TPR6_ANGAN
MTSLFTMQPDADPSIAFCLLSVKTLSNMKLEEAFLSQCVPVTV